MSGYFASPWLGEDGGPERLQVPRSRTGLNLQPGETLRCVTRNTIMLTMTVLGNPGAIGRAQVRASPETKPPS